MIVTEAEALLREASLRVTQPRVAVLSVLDEVPHIDAGELVAIVRERWGAVSTQAVYDVLKALVTVRLVRRIDLPNSPARYERQEREHRHQHVVCRGCGMIADVDEPAGTVLPPAGHDHGFVIDGVDVTYWGLCPRCQAAAPESELLKRYSYKGANE